MTKNLLDLWIVKDDGMVIFREWFERTMETQAFGAILSSIMQVAKTISTGQISKFDFADRRMNILKRDELLVCATSLKKVSEKKAVAEIKDIAKRFIMNYPRELAQFKGDITVFKDFEP